MTSPALQVESFRVYSQLVTAVSASVKLSVIVKVPAVCVPLSGVTANSPSATGGVESPPAVTVMVSWVAAYPLDEVSPEPTPTR